MILSAAIGRLQLPIQTQERRPWAHWNLVVAHDEHGSCLGSSRAVDQDRVTAASKLILHP